MREAMSEILNKAGGAMMAISFAVIAVMLFTHARQAKKKYRRFLIYSFAVFIITSGISRFIGVFDTYDNKDLLNGVFKTISGTVGIVAMFLFPRAVKELSNVQTLEKIHEEVEVTNQKIENLMDMGEKFNIRHPRE
jgi:uncharacterized membrane protein HdeD (DUF308 family)